MKVEACFMILKHNLRKKLGRILVHFWLSYQQWIYFVGRVWIRNPHPKYAHVNNYLKQFQTNPFNHLVLWLYGGCTSELWKGGDIRYSTVQYSIILFLFIYCHFFAFVNFMCLLHFECVAKCNAFNGSFALTVMVRALIAVF